LSPVDATSGHVPSISSFTSPEPHASSPSAAPTRSSLKPPENPRDHSLLEHIYTETHAARFINLTPVAIVSNSMPLQAVRSHPPLMVMFPPSPGASAMSNALPEASILSPSMLGLEEWGGVAAPPARETVAEQVARLDLALAHPHPDQRAPFIDVPDLISGSRLYARTDMARYTAHGPRSIFQPNRFQVGQPHASAERTAHGSQGKEGGAVSQTRGTSAVKDPVKDRLHIDSIKFDMRTLNLQLSLRVQEVLACSEAMWDFVLDYQKAHSPPAEPAQNPKGRFSRQNSDAGPFAPRPVKPHSVPGSMEDMLMDLTRPKFDLLLSRFKLDMQDYMSLGSVLQDRLRWDPVPPSRTNERKQFDIMCKLWAQYQEELRSELVTRPSASPSTTTTLVDMSDSHNRHAKVAGKDEDMLHSGKVQSRLELTNMHNQPHERLSQASDVDEERPPRLDPVPPYDRLCRTMRSFVGFKA